MKHLEGDGRVLMQIQPQYLSGVNKKSQATHYTVKQASDCDSKPQSLTPVFMTENVTTSRLSQGSDNDHSD